MASSKGNKWFFVVIVLFLLTGGAWFGVSYVEGMLVRQVEAIIEKIPGKLSVGTVKATAWPLGIHLSDVHFEDIFESQRRMTVTVKTIMIEPKWLTLRDGIENVIIDGFAQSVALLVRPEGVPEKIYDCSYDSMEFLGIQNIEDVVAAFEKLTTATETGGDDRFLQLWAFLSKVQVSTHKATACKMSTYMDTLSGVFSLAEFRANDVSLIHVGQMQSTDLLWDFGALGSLRFETLTSDGIAMSADYYLLDGQRGQGEDAAEIFLSLFPQIIRAKNVVFKNGSLQIDVLSKEPVTIKEWLIDYELGKELGSFVQHMEHFVVPAALVTAMEVVPFYQEIYGKALDLTGKINVEYSNGKESSEFTVHELSLVEANLGGGSVSFVVHALVKDLFAGDVESGKLASLEVRLENEGVVDVVARLLVAASLGSADPKIVEPAAKEMRANVSQEIAALVQGEDLNQENKQLLEDLDRVLRTHGVFFAKFIPNEPVDTLKEETIFEVPARLESSFTPAVQ